MRRPQDDMPRVARPRSGWWGSLCIGFVASLAAAAPSTVRAGGATIVSLGFDDTWASHYTAHTLLARHGMRATFFVNSGLVGQPERLTWAQIRELAKQGHEIGGHAATHADLPTLGPGEQHREVCGDRAALLGHGVRPTNFAYPFARFDSTTRAIVQECGYNSARTVGGTQCFECPNAETIPPADAYATRTQLVHSTTTLETLQCFVTRAEQSGGGWVQIVFHQVCDGCGIYGLSETILARFVDWLAPRKANGTLVRTVQEVIGGEVAPVMAARPEPRAGIGSE